MRLFDQTHAAQIVEIGVSTNVTAKCVLWAPFSNGNNPTSEILLVDDAPNLGSYRFGISVK